jgi:prevent-host-death family protein
VGRAGAHADSYGELIVSEMIRKQFYVHKRQQVLLRKLARTNGVSESEIIRQAIERNMTIRIVPISELRRQTTQIIRAVQKDGDVVRVTRYGRPAVVLVDYEQYEALLAQLQELTDLASLEAAAGEPERDYEAFLAEMEPRA